MDAKQLIEQMRQQRRRWLDLKGGKRVRIQMPTDLEVVRDFMAPGDDGKLALRADIDQVRKYVVDWEGFTTADLLGAAVGSDQPAPFDPGIWDLVIQDHLDWVRLIAQGLLDAIVQRQQQRETDAGN